MSKKNIDEQIEQLKNSILKMKDEGFMLILDAFLMTMTFYQGKEAGLRELIEIQRYLETKVIRR